MISAGTRLACIMVLLAGWASSATSAQSMADIVRSSDSLAALLKNEVTVSSRDNGQRTALHWAALQGKVQMVEALIAAGADVNARDQSGQTPAIFAAMGPNGMQVLRMLKSKGANVLIRDLSGGSALHSVGSREIAEWLLAQGLEADAKTNAGVTPLFQAKNAPIALAFLEKGAKVDARTENNATALEFAARSGRADVAEVLLGWGADVNAKYRRGETVLHMAASDRGIQAIPLLIAKGASVDAMDSGGNTPLHWAATRSTDDRVIPLLISSGANVNSRNLKGRTPLLSAAARGAAKIVGALLKGGADITATDSEGNNALHSAASALSHNKEGIESIEMLLAAGIDIESRTTKGETPLLLAARGSYKKEEVVEVLLRHGAKVDTPSAAGDTPWSSAATPAIAALMLKHGANVNARIRGWTALHSAASRGDRQMVEVLLRAGADIAVLNERQEGPLLYAKPEVISLLSGSNPRVAIAQLTPRLVLYGLDNDVRIAMLKLSKDIKPPLEIPEAARKWFVEGSAIVRATTSPAQLALAVQGFSEAIRSAPWWADAYYNLGVAYELAGKFDDAEKAFKCYLLVAPGDVERREAQDRIYGLSAKRKMTNVK